MFDMGPSIDTGKLKFCSLVLSITSHSAEDKPTAAEGTERVLIPFGQFSLSLSETLKIQFIVRKQNLMVYNFRETSLCLRFKYCFYFTCDDS